MLEHPHKKLNMANTCLLPQQCVWGGRGKRVIIIALGSAKGLLEREIGQAVPAHIYAYTTQRGGERQTHTRERGRERLSPKRNVGEIKWLTVQSYGGTTHKVQTTFYLQPSHPNARALSSAQ